MVRVWSCKYGSRMCGQWHTLLCRRCSHTASAYKYTFSAYVYTLANEPANVYTNLDGRASDGHAHANGGSDAVDCWRH